MGVRVPPFAPARARLQSGPRAPTPDEPNAAHGAASGDLHLKDSRRMQTTLETLSGLERRLNVALFFQRRFFSPPVIGAAADLR